MKPASQVTALVVSNGLDVSLAMKLAETYKRVLFWVPQDDEFPKLNDGMIGVGMGKIEVIDDPWGGAYDDADLWVFPDLGFGGLQLRLESQGKVVWGARNGEEMEQDRAAMKRHLASLGLPVGEWTTVRGFTALREYLKAHKNVYVKLSRWRGSWETLLSEDYQFSKPVLDEREQDLSGVSETLEFIVESKLADGVEMATDSWNIDGQFPASTLVGIEHKDKAYVGRFLPWDEVSEPLRHLNAALAPTLKNYGYRGFFSPETLVVGQDPFLNDPCCRIPEPPGSLYLEFYTNLAEIIWAGANGQMIEPRSLAPVGVQIILHSEWSHAHWNTFSWPKKYDRNVKLREACKVGPNPCSIPQHIGLSQPGAIIAWGETLDEAEAMARDVAESIKATNLRVPLDAFDAIRETLEKAKTVGLSI